MPVDPKSQQAGRRWLQANPEPDTPGYFDAMTNGNTWGEIAKQVHSDQQGYRPQGTIKLPNKITGNPLIDGWNVHSAVFGSPTNWLLSLMGIQ